MQTEPVYAAVKKETKVIRTLPPLPVRPPRPPSPSLIHSPPPPPLESPIHSGSVTVTANDLKSPPNDDTTKTSFINTKSESCYSELPSRDVIVTSADVHAPDYVTSDSILGRKNSMAEKTPTNDDDNDVFEESYYGHVSFSYPWFALLDGPRFH